MPDSLTIHWPEPAHLRLDTKDGEAEPCEIQFDDGTVEVGDLLRFTGRDEHLVFRPHSGHPRYPSKIVVRNARFKRLKLLDLVEVHPIEASVFGVAVEPIDPQQMHVYNVEFTDHEIESGDTAGFVHNQIGLFLYFGRPGNKVERIFVPKTAIAYFQAGEPIGRLLLEENAVSEEQLAAAVEKQQEMRKLVLGDYLIEEGLISAGQLEGALAHQRTKPSLRLGEALIEMGAIQPEALQIVLARQRANRGRPLGQILVDMGIVDADTLNKIHAKKTGRHFVSLANFAPSDEAILAISGSSARRLGIVPLSVEHGDLIVASERPLDSGALNELTLLSKMRVVQVQAPGQEIEARRTEAYGSKADDDAVSDPSMIRFEGMEVIDAGLHGDEARPESVFRESTDGMTDPLLIEAIEHAIEAVETGGNGSTSTSSPAARNARPASATSADRDTLAGHLTRACRGPESRRVGHRALPRIRSRTPSSCSRSAKSTSSWPRPLLRMRIATFVARRSDSSVSSCATSPPVRPPARAAARDVPGACALVRATSFSASRTDKRLATTSFATVI